MSNSLSDGEVLAMRVSDPNPTPMPGPYVPPAEKPRIGDWADEWAQAGPLHWEITADTSAEAIAESQRKDVEKAYRRLGFDPPAIAAAIVLPVWSVERRLAELGITA